MTPINHPDAMSAARNDAGALVWSGNQGWCILPSGSGYALPCGHATARLAIRTHNMTAKRHADGVLYSSNAQGASS